MKPQAEAWVDVAEIDYKTAVWTARSPQRISESVCYHAQQCVEKYFKALLEEHDRPVPRTHDLLALLDLVQEWVPELLPSREDIRNLGTYAIAFRYPHDPIEFDELSELADDALRLMTETRQLVSAHLEIKEIEEEADPAT